MIRRHPLRSWLLPWLTTLLLSLSLLFASAVFAQSIPMSAVVQRDANLRAGPGTSFAIVGAAKPGQAVTIVEKNADGTWYHLDNGHWIAAFLVTAAVPPSPAAPVPAATPAPGNSPTLVVHTVFYDGAVPDTESDEYAVIVNMGTAAVNLLGWQLSAGTPDQVVTLPRYELQPGQSCRVYTNEIRRDYCGVSFGSGTALWNNQGDCGYLYDPSGGHQSTYCYGDITGGEAYTAGATSSPAGATANRNANLRGGPGTSFPVVGTVGLGQALPVVATNPAGDWYQLANGQWIAAFLVNNAAGVAAVEAGAPASTPAPASPTPAPAPTRNPLSGQRSGAVCRDGSTSSATGRGACSHHGGVDHWLYYP